MRKNAFIRRTSIVALAFVAAASLMTGSAKAQTTDASLPAVAGACADQASSSLNNIQLPSLPTDLSSGIELKGFEVPISTFNADKPLETLKTECQAGTATSVLNIPTPKIDLLISPTLPDAQAGKELGEPIDLLAQLSSEVMSSMTVAATVVSPDVATPAVARLPQLKQPASPIVSTAGDEVKTDMPKSPAAVPETSDTLKQSKPSQATPVYASSDIVLNFRHSAAVILLIGGVLVGFSYRKLINKALSRSSKIIRNAKKNFINYVKKPTTEKQSSADETSTHDVQLALADSGDVSSFERPPISRDEGERAHDYFRGIMARYEQPVAAMPAKVSSQGADGDLGWKLLMRATGIAQINKRSEPDATQTAVQSTALAALKVEWRRAQAALTQRNKLIKGIEKRGKIQPSDERKIEKANQRLQRHLIAMDSEVELAMGGDALTTYRAIRCLALHKSQNYAQRLQLVINNLDAIGKKSQRTHDNAVRFIFMHGDASARISVAKRHATILRRSPRRLKLQSVA